MENLKKFSSNFNIKLMLCLSLRGHELSYRWIGIPKTLQPITVLYQWSTAQTLWCWKYWWQLTYGMFVWAVRMTGYMGWSTFCKNFFHSNKQGYAWVQIWHTHSMYGVRPGACSHPWHIWFLECLGCNLDGIYILIMFQYIWHKVSIFPIRC